MVAGTGEWRSFHVGESERSPRRCQALELVRLPPASYTKMVATRSEILTDRGNRHPYRAQVAEGGDDFLLGFPESDHQTGLGDQPGVGGPGEHGKAASVSSGWPDGSLQSCHRLDVVIEDIRACLDNLVQRWTIALAVRDQHLDLRTGAATADGSNGVSDGRGTAIGQVVAGDARHHGMGYAHLSHSVGNARGLVRIEREWSA